MMRLFKKRLEDTFRTGKENGFRKIFRNWLSADGFGICRPCRNPILQDAQAMKAIQRIPASQIALIAASPAAQQLIKISQKQKMFSAAAALPDAVRGEVCRVKTPDWLDKRNRT